MQFCVISPTAGLQRFSTLSKRHLVLPQVTNPLYRGFYQQRRFANECIILDNGAYEGRLDEQTLLDSIGFYNPHVVVAPDILLGDAAESYKLADRFITHWRACCNAEWMFVPQAPPGEFDRFVTYLKFALDNIKPEWVGLPRVLATDIAPTNPYIRADVCAIIKQHHPHTYVHALGMVDGDYTELPYLEQAGCDSIDSSCAVWRGWRGFKLDDPSQRAAWKTKGTECDFEVSPNTLKAHNETIIKHNLSLVGVKG